MKNISLILFALTIMLCSCHKNKQQTKESTESQTETQQLQFPVFPYQAYLDAAEDNEFPEIEDDGRGFEAICHKIRYPQVPDTLKLNLFADSLLQFYNFVLAFNAISYDEGTANRFLMDKDYEQALTYAKALESANVNGISDIGIRNALRAVAQKAAYSIRNYVENQNPADRQEVDDAVETFYEQCDKIVLPLLNGRQFEAEFEPAQVVKEYQTIHERAVTDTLYYKDLLQKVLREQDFQRACILAREYAYANRISETGDGKTFVAVIDKLLRADKYSPLLRELWLMWRTALQIEIFSGRSNYSAMYNLFYNDMRNRIALVYITHLNEHPSDNLAFQEFAKLAQQSNIVRNSECIMGNNAILDDFELYSVCRNNDIDS